MNSRASEIVVGIDLGTQGVRAIAVDVNGVELGESQRTLQSGAIFDAQAQEQNAEEWWSAVCDGLRELISGLPSSVNIAGVSVDGTAGTVFLLDAQGNPLHHAIIYNYSRCCSLLEEIWDQLHGLEQRLGVKIMSTFGLPKIIWLLRERLDLVEKARYLAHPTDFLIARLTGVLGVTDDATPLKTGYDCARSSWPEELETRFGIPREWLPEVRPSGSRIGSVTMASSQQCGLAAGTPVILGTTDGVAALYASGACKIGSWSSSLGTTLVVRGITPEPIQDSLGLLQNYQHPDGAWIPGGACRVGCAWIVADFKGSHPKDLDRDAAARLPTDLLRYSLVGVGEVFPFFDPNACGFLVGSSRDTIDAYASGLEGVAFIERLAYEQIDSLGGPVEGVLRSTGGGCRSALWLRLRASVLGRPIMVPRVNEAAMGAALLAATNSWYGSIAEATERMVHYQSPVDPCPDWVAAYEQKFAAFAEELGKRTLLHKMSGAAGDFMQ